ncbi:MAG: NAD-dependent epimerase/dehydratase family protein [Candidatus Methylacidiphilales bacterium]
MSTTPQQILVTGGAGFVGSHLAIALKAAFPSSQVTVLDNLHRRGSELNLPRLQDVGCAFHRGDIRDPSSFPEGPFDWLIECSAEPSVLAGYHESPDYLMQTNLMGTYHCLEACRRWNASLLFLSTSRVYPIAPMEQHPWKEEATRFVWHDDTQSSLISSSGVKEDLADMAWGARSLYGFTKYASEMLIEEYRQAFGLRAIINRCSVLAGPWQMGKVDQGVIALWVLRHHFRQPLSYIGYGGTGKQVRDALHVDDLKELIIRQIHESDDWLGWRGNVGGGKSVSTSLMELTELCAEITGNQVEIHAVPETRRADLRIFLADTSRLQLDHHWMPSRTLRDMVADTHNWLREHEVLIRQAGIGA